MLRTQAYAGFDLGDRIREGDGLRAFVAAALVFDLALLQSAVADHEAMRDTDQFHVGEHDARALIAVIQQHFDAGRRQLGIKFFRGLAYAGTLAHADRHYCELEWRDRERPDDAALVVILLDRRGNDARDADSVATHFHRLV